MSYNTRRSGGGAPFNSNNGMNNRPMANRGGLQQNFVSSGQYQSSPKPLVQQPVRQQQAAVQQQRQPPPKQQAQQKPAPLMAQSPQFPPPQSMIPPKAQQPAQQQQQPAQQQQQPPQQQQQPEKAQPAVQAQQPPQPQLHQPPAVLPPAPLKSALKKTETTVQQTPAVSEVMKVEPPSPTIVPAVAPTITDEMADELLEEQNGDVKTKTFSIKGTKISKKEKRGRRNKRLRKILMPKNALMVLNELVGGHKFNFLEKDAKAANAHFYVEPESYVASVTIDGTEHIGQGKNKAAAKTSAAEAALRHIIMSKMGLSSSVTGSVDGDADVTMEVEPTTTTTTGGEDGGGDATPKQDDDDVSWLHVASFAMHKLFLSWYVDGEEKAEQVGAAVAAKLQDVKSSQSSPTQTRKPAKQLPANPQLLNPVMLLNQMRDDVLYEDVAKEGSRPPHMVFTIKTTLDGQNFFGKGNNKKLARKYCAFIACSKLYNIKYPEDEFDPNNTYSSMYEPMME